MTLMTQDSEKVYSNQLQYDSQILNAQEVKAGDKTNNQAKANKRTGRESEK